MLVEGATVELGEVVTTYHLGTSRASCADLFPRPPAANCIWSRANWFARVRPSPNLPRCGAERASDVAKARGVSEAERLHASGISDKELQDARVFPPCLRRHTAKPPLARLHKHDSPIAGTVSVREVRVGELANSGRRAPCG